MIFNMYVTLFYCYTDKTMNCDILVCIFMYSTLWDIINCSLVCKLFYDATRKQILWKCGIDTIFTNHNVTGDYFTQFKKHFILDSFFVKNNKCGVNKYLRTDTIYLNHSPIGDIPIEFDILTNLRTLWLNNTGLCDFPLSVTRLSNLKILYLHCNQLRSVPREIGLLQKLKELHLDNNHLKYIPAEIGLLRNLIFLDLHNNQLLSIPRELKQLTALISLDVANNILTCIPTDIRQLSNLTIHLDITQQGMVTPSDSCEYQFDH